MKKFNTLLLCATSTLWSLNASAEHVQAVQPNQDASGTFLVTKAEHLQWLAQNTDKYQNTPLNIKLLADITMAEGEKIQPIGYNNLYYGTFDGQGHTIQYNLDIPSNSSYMGLFYKVQGAMQRACVKNLHILNAKLTGHNQIGAVTGFAYNADFENVVVEGASLRGVAYIGGLVGNCALNVTFANCASIKSQIVCESKGFNWDSTMSLYPGRYGGIFGYADNTNVSSCYSDIHIYSQDGAQEIGGIGGYMEVRRSDLKIEKCTSAAYILGSEVGNVVQPHNSQSGAYIGGIFGRVVSNTIQPFTFHQLISAASFAAGTNSATDKIGRIFGWYGLNETCTSEPLLTLDECYACSSTLDSDALYNKDSEYRFKTSPYDGTPYDQTNVINRTAMYGGRLAFYLNTAAGSDDWAQNLCSDPVPVPATITVGGHHHGIQPHEQAVSECSHCAKTGLTPCQQPAYDPETQSYLISNAGEYIWYRDVVNRIMPTVAEYEDLLTNGTSIEYFCPMNARLTADIDLSSVKDHSLIAVGNKRFFMGSTFDGQGHEISGLVYDIDLSDNTDATEAGLFGNTYMSDIRGIRLTHSSIKGKGFVGGIVGAGINTDISNCYTDASTTISSNLHAAGIAGIITNTSDTPHSINHCTNNATVYGGMYIGGICGQSVNTDITACFNSSNAIYTTLKLGSFVGGIVGNPNGCSVTLCGNTGNINCNPSATAFDASQVNCVGGVCGDLNNATLSGSYSIARELRGIGDKTAALVGLQRNGSSINNCYYNNEAVCYTATDESFELLPHRGNDHLNADVTTPLNLKDFKTKATLDKFVATTGDSNWTLLACRDKAPVYHGCYSFDNGQPAGGKIIDTHGYQAKSTDFKNGLCIYCGKHQDPKQDSEGYYLLSKASDLEWLREMYEDDEPTLNCRLTADIDLRDYPTWESIALNSSEGYQGEFDGQGHTIRNIRAAIGNEVFSGLFSKVYRAHIHDLTLYAGYVSGGIQYANGGTEDIVDPETNKHYDSGLETGILAGYAQESLIEGITTEGFLRSSGDVGGIVGTATVCDFKDCTNSAAIDAAHWFNSPYNGAYVGGIVGSAFDSTFDRCFSDEAAGGIQAVRALAIGGIAGYAYGNATFTHCGNVARVSSSCRCGVNDCKHRYAGGIVGHYNSNKPDSKIVMTRSYGYGDVICSPDKGGVYAGMLGGYIDGEWEMDHLVFNNENSENLSPFDRFSEGMGFDYIDSSLYADDFANGNAAALLGAPWGHTFFADMDGLYTIEDFGMYQPDRFPRLCNMKTTDVDVQRPYWPVFRWASDSQLHWAGDINGNGTIDLDDINLIRDYVLDQFTGAGIYKEAQIMGSDLNGDGTVTISDLTAFFNFIKRYQAVKKYIEDINNPEGETGWEGEPGWEGGE